MYHMMIVKFNIILPTIEYFYQITTSIFVHNKQNISVYCWNQLFRSFRFLIKNKFTQSCNAILEFNAYNNICYTAVLYVCIPKKGMLKLWSHQTVYSSKCNKILTKALTLIFINYAITLIGLVFLKAMIYGRQFTI